MNFDKQLLMVQYLAFSPDVFTLCMAIIEPKYFDTKLQPCVNLLKEYYDKYHNLPNQDVIKAETGLSLPTFFIERDQIAYSCDEIERFCKQQAMRHLAFDMPQLVSEENYGAIEQKMRDVVLMSLNRNLGQDYFEDVEERANRLINQGDVISTGYQNLDDYISLKRGEMLLVSANSGGGKSLTMGNLAYNFANQGYDTLYISLELTEDRIGQRIDSIISNINPKNYEQNVEEIITKVKQYHQDKKHGNLRIVRLKTKIDANAVRGYLKEYELHFRSVPDVIIVDYMGRMLPNDKRIREEHTKDEAISDELRDIAVDYDALMISASQQNRDGHDAKITEVGQQHLAGGMAKINPTDAALSVVFTDTMKAAGEIAFRLIKCRNSDGVGKIVWLDWDSNAMRIRDREQNISKINITEILEEKRAANKRMSQQTKKPTFTELLNSEE